MINSCNEKFKVSKFYFAPKLHLRKKLLNLFQVTTGFILVLQNIYSTEIGFRFYQKFIKHSLPRFIAILENCVTFKKNENQFRLCIKWHEASNQ